MIRQVLGFSREEFRALPWHDSRMYLEELHREHAERLRVDGPGPLGSAGQIEQPDQPALEAAPPPARASGIRIPRRVAYVDVDVAE